jgi:hypothetical protein
MTNEEWVDVPDFDGIYQISRDGRVQSLDREVGDFLHRHRVRGHEMRTTVRYGRTMVSLYRDNAHRLYDMHELIAKTFADQAGG